MESGRREFHLVPTEVRDVVSSATRAFSPMTERHAVKLRVDEPEEPVFLQADRDALADAVLNLLLNAQKYGGEPPEVALVAEATDREVLLSVSDNGSGIPRDEHQRIFQKFYRVDDRLSREREGSGLGLAIVKHVVKAHRGKVRVSSEPGRGSTFTMVFPRLAAPQAGAPGPDEDRDG